MWQKYSICPKKLSKASPFQDTIPPLQIPNFHQSPNLQKSPLMASPLLLSTPIHSLSPHSKHLKISSFHNKPVIKLPIFKKPSTNANTNNPFKSLHILRRIGVRTSIEEKNSVGLDDEFSREVGEDAAYFDVNDQKISSWVYFSVVLGVVLVALDVVWIDSSFGFGYGKAFVDAVSGLSESHEVVMLLLIFIFAGYHSGMASLRDSGEKLIGPRAFRVLFAGISLPLAVSTVVYFINHRYDGIQLWQLQSVPWLHHLLWISNFISFFFLYPSTFNLLEVAAVDKPKLHLWETGIMRITRHPQMVGQVIWCLAHAIWIGNSVAVAASAGLIGHHLFGVWNGDRRLSLRHGEAFEIVKSRTSVIPFAAILDGRQKLPKDYYKEFLRLPYLTITGITLGAYLAHPLMHAASYRLPW